MATTLNGNSSPHPHMSSVGKSREDFAHIFRFFDLPRELRDKIHEQPVLMEQWHAPTIMLLDRDRYTQGEKLNTSLLLVNRQFRDEYTERCLDQQTLCLRDCLDFSDVIGVLNVLDELRSWVLAICTTESIAQPTAPSMLESYIGKCAHWYHDLRAVNIRLYLSYQGNLEDDAPYIFDHLQSTIADIASFEKISGLEIYITKPTRRHTTASWSRKLLARWRRDDPEATILLGPALHTECSEWEDFKGFGIDVDCSISSSSSSSGSWSHYGGDGNEQENFNEDDQDGDGTQGENVPLYAELLHQKDYVSADENEDAVQLPGEEHPESKHANNTSKQFELFKLPREIRNSIYGQPGMLQDQVLSWESRMAFDPYNAVTAIKPRQPLLLVNRQFNMEYRESCEGRIGVFVDTRMEYLEPKWGPAVTLSRNAAQGAYFLRLRAGDWFVSKDDDSINYLDSVYAWTRYWCSQMPNLRSLHVQVHIDDNLTSKELERIRANVSQMLSLEKLHQCEFIVMSDSGSYRNQDQPKRTLFQWKLGDSSSPLFNNPPIELLEPCWDCETQIRGNSTLRAFEMIMNGEGTHDEYNEESPNPYLRFYKDHTGSGRTANVRPTSPANIDPPQSADEMEALIVNTAASALASRPPPQDCTREMRLLRIICLGLLAIFVLILVCDVSDMIFASR